MIEDEARTVALRLGTAANDNGSAESRVESAMLIITRLIDRQIAREAYERLNAINDNPPSSTCHAHAASGQ